MKNLKFFFLFLIFFGGTLNHSPILFAQQNSSDTPQSNNEESEKKLEEIDIELLKYAKIYPCLLDNEQEFQIAVLENGEAYLIFNQSYVKIPIRIKLNPEDIEVTCNNQKLILESKGPLTNIKLKQIFSYQNQELQLIGTSQEDLNNNYFDSLFELVLKGNKKKILSTELKEIPFAYQYINSEKLLHFMYTVIEKTQTMDIQSKINVLSSFGILSTKLIYYYHMNSSSLKKMLEDYKTWILAWEYIGLENYEDFILHYGEAILSMNPTEGESILNFLKEKKPDYLLTYIVMGNHYWKTKQKQKAIELYKKAIEINQEKFKNQFIDEQNHVSNIPDYVYERINDEL